jgi:formate dehydrogenase subunit gamma
MSTIQRYGLTERLIHAVAGLSYLYLLLTGLAFWTPALYWIAVALGGGYLSRLLHPWAGFVFAAAVAWMSLVWWREMRITDADRGWRKAIGRYIRNDDSAVPAVGRFNYGQKMLFWLMAVGGVLLLASGAVMWLVAEVPAELQVLRTSATLLHALAALLTIGGFIVHVYMGVAVVPGGLNAILNGEVSEQWAERHHSLWLTELRAAPHRQGIGEVRKPGSPRVGPPR